MKTPSAQNLVAMLGCFALGVVATVVIWSWYQHNRAHVTAGALEKCEAVVSVAIPPPWDNEAYSRRALLISDCMASNNFIFRGTGSESSCYAINPIQQQLQHILPSCYKPVSGQLLWSY